MEKQELFDFYEKLYFNEVEAREKIAARLQIPLAILLSIASLYGFFLKGYSFSNTALWNIVFSLIGVASLIVYARSIYYFRQAFWGSTYELLTTAGSAEQYRKDYLNWYTANNSNLSSIDCEMQAATRFKEYLQENYIKCSTNNTLINDGRSHALHRCNLFIITNMLFLAVLFVIFIFVDIDKNNTEKEYKVKISNSLIIDSKSSPIEVKGKLDSTTLKVDFSDDLKEIIMNDKAKSSPPAPEPPPNRQLREDYAIPKPTQPAAPPKK